MEQAISTISLVISALAFGLSGVALWYSYFRKGKPKFVCSRWTAIRMQHVSGEPRAAFSVYVTVVNEGKRPLEIRDLLLVADTNDGPPIFYEPILLWDLRQWIEDGDRPDKVGRAQKAQVPLPIQLNADQYYDFEYPILFLPLDKQTMVEPLKHSAVQLRLYAFTDREDGYVQIGEQVMEDANIKDLVDKAFSGAVSTVWKAKRARFIEGLQNRGIKGR